MAESNIQEIIIIGRDQTCNFIVDDSSVSRNHAQIINYGTHVCVVDLGSTNGTFVNGVRVSSETSLHTGDELKVGNAIVPWEQLVDPSKGGNGRGKKKTWLWILIAGIVLLFIGAAAAVYFLWIHNNLEESKKSNDELLEEVISGVKEKQKTDSLLVVARDSANLVRQEAQAEKEKNEKKNETLKAENEKIKKDSEKETAKAQKEKDEAKKAKEAAKREKDDAIKAKEEAEKAKEEAEKAKKEAEKAKEEAEKAKEEAENIKYESILPVLNALEKEDLEDVCRDLGIVFNVQKPAKEALKEEFWNGTNDTKNKIAKALKAKQKSANP